MAGKKISKRGNYGIRRLYFQFGQGFFFPEKYSPLISTSHLLLHRSFSRLYLYYTYLKLFFLCFSLKKCNILNFQQVQCLRFTNNSFHTYFSFLFHPSKPAIQQFRIILVAPSFLKLKFRPHKLITVSLIFFFSERICNYRLPFNLLFSSDNKVDLGLH